MFLELQFLGGACEVGRSAVILKGSKRLLFDYGLKLDGKTTYPLQAGNIDACFVSHAHLDHSGNLPSLYKTEMPTVYGTGATKELSSLLIEDSVKVHKKTHQAQKYSKQQIKLLMNRYSSFEFGSEIDMGDYAVTLHDAGHVSGSVMFLVENRKNGRKLVYTGDFKLEPQILQGGAEQLKCDILITESTYATRDHPNREELIKKFISEVREVLDNGGTALVPVFAVGRAQELLAILYKHGLIEYTFIDGMAKKATEITMRYPESIKNEDILQQAVRRVTWVGKEIHRGEALGSSGIIVTTAGMLNGGPVLDYITNLNDQSKIFLTGYQVEHTNGRRLMENRPLIIDGQKHQIKTPWVYYDFSAHVGKADHYKYVKQSNPETVVCMHGDEAAAEDFAENLKMEGFSAYAPRIGDSLKVDF